MKSLGIAVMLALAAFGGVRSGAAAACKGAAWCGMHTVTVNGVRVSCHQYHCRTHGRVEHSEVH